MYAKAKYKNTMMAISITRSLVVTGLAVCCALAAAACNACAEGLDADDPEAAAIAELVQWHSGTSAASDFCGAREESLLHVRYRRMYAVFLVLHGAPGVPQEYELDVSLTSLDIPNFPP